MANLLRGNWKNDADNEKQAVLPSSFARFEWPVEEHEFMFGLGYTEHQLITGRY